MRKNTNAVRRARLVRRHYALVACFLVIVFSAGLAWAQQEVEFNYNGRVHVAGSPFSGTGYFKFSLVTGSPETTIWANDGAAIDGSEPSSSIATTVTQGFFSVDIGDTSTPNMVRLNPTLFNRDDKVYLRSWFSDGTHGFEQMHPDRRVVNPALLGSTSFDVLTLYVDPVSGSDDRNGATTATAKRTILAAWDSLPATLSTTATIHLVPGTYRESVMLAGRVVTSQARLVIEGDRSDPSRVVFEGTDDTGTTPTISRIMHVRDQRNLTLAGFRVAGGTFLHGSTEITSDMGSEVEIADCVFDHCIMSATHNAIVTARRVESYFDERAPNQHVPNNYGSISAKFGSHFEIAECLFHDAEYGAHIGYGSTARFANTTFDDCYWGIGVFSSSSVYISPGTVVSYCHDGVVGQMNSTILWTNNLTFTGTEANNILLYTGARNSP